MKYALLICAPVDGEELGPADDPRFSSYSEEVRRRDLVKGGARLRPASDATTVRVQGDEVLLTDGPFAESEEYLAGVDFVEVADLDEAISLASRHPAALDGGSVEVRPVWE
ncbi:YciI family protein [Streptomyces sp. NRRL B-24085]|uniref:YciI family protein n=1 Tax=Streptomyces sp. NRRL B-24085 TaxID=1709476 RepID=UPI0006B33DFD|nr:YciI family protein [Streptomyces sp. NRRL B-24085]